MAQSIILKGLDLVRSKQEADPGSLSGCQNFEITNVRGLTEIQGIKAFSGGVGNDVINPYILHSYGESAGTNLTSVSGTFTSGAEGWILKWGSGGNYNAKTGELTTVDGYASVCFSRRQSASLILLALYDITGRMPAVGDVIVTDVYTITATVSAAPILASDMVDGSIAAFGSSYAAPTGGVDGASQLINDFDCGPGSTDSVAYPLPVNPLGSVKGLFYFKDSLYAIGDIETWAFTSGSAEPSEGDTFYLYYSGTAPTGNAYSYTVERVVTTSGEWNAGTAAGNIWLVLNVSTASKASVITPTDCRNNTTAVNDPMTIGALSRSSGAGLWKSVGQSLVTGTSGSLWARQDLGHEISFNSGNNYPTVLNRANRDSALELTVNTAAWATCGTAAAASGWVDPTNAQGASDSVVTTQPNDGFPREKLTCTNFGFNLPGTAVILGVEMRFRRNVTGGSARDTHIYLTGTPTSQDKKKSALWHTGAIGVAGALSDVYGGTSDLWGTEITASMVNSADFGVTIEVFNAGATGGDRQIDSVEIQITYKDRSSVVYFRDTVAGTDVSTGRVIWYHKEKGAWTPTNTAEGTLTVYELSAASSIRAGHTIRTASGGGGLLIATCSSAAGKVYLPPSNALETNASQWQFTTEVNFFGAIGTEQIFGTSGAGFANSYDGNYWIRIRTGADANQDQPRHVVKFGDQLVLGYLQGVCMASDLGYPESFAGVPGGTLGGSSPISDDLTTYPTFAGGAQEIKLGDSVYGMLNLADQNLAVGCKNSIQMLVGSGGSLVNRRVSGSSGIVEGTLVDLGIPVFIDYRGIGTLSATDAFGDFARGRLSDDVAPWLIPRLQETGASFVSNNGPIKTEVIRNKNQLRTIFRDKYVLTMTMIGNDFSNPQFTIQQLPFVPASTCTGVTSGGKDLFFLAPYGMAEGGAFTNDLKSLYDGSDTYTPHANVYAPAFVYQGDVGTSWDGLAPIDGYIEINGGAAGREFETKHYDKMLVHGQAYGFAPFGCRFAVNYEEVGTGTPQNVNGGSTAGNGDLAFVLRPFSKVEKIRTSIGSDGFALTIQIVSSGASVYGATSTQTSPYKFRPFTIQSIIVISETLKTRPPNAGT